MGFLKYIPPTPLKIESPFSVCIPEAAVAYGPVRFLFHTGPNVPQITVYRRKSDIPILRAFDGKRVFNIERIVIFSEVNPCPFIGLLCGMRAEQHSHRPVTKETVVPAPDIETPGKAEKMSRREGADQLF